MDLERIRPEIPDHRRSRMYVKAIAILLGGNILLAAVKGFLAWTTGSSAIFSDAANSLSDILYSLLLALGLYISQRPPDLSHPQGHRRFDPLVSLFVTAAMALAGITAFHQGIQRFLEGAREIELGMATGVLAGAVLVKLWMFREIYRIGNKAGSPGLKASAQDNLMDTLTTTAAVAGIWGSRYVHPALDPIAGIAVALWIFRTTWIVGSESIRYLTGSGPPDEMIETIRACAAGVSEVRSVHRVIADYIGPELRVDIHIDLDAGMTLAHAHEISDRVQEQVEAVPGVDIVYVHIDPFYRS